MPLSEGDQAEVWDHWLRAITNKKHVYSSRKRIHHSAFGGAGGLAPTTTRTWTNELSGRLNSLAIDACSDAQKFCAALGLAYCGIMYAQVGVLRDNKFGFDTDVRYTPTGEDRAHADFVVFGAPTDFELDSIKDWLRENILVPLTPGKAPTVISQLPRVSP